MSKQNESMDVYLCYILFMHSAFPSWRMSKDMFYYHWNYFQQYGKMMAIECHLARLLSKSGIYNVKSTGICLQGFWVQYIASNCTKMYNKFCPLKK